MTRIGVFCGSNVGNQAAFRQAAVDLARALARRGFGLRVADSVIRVVSAMPVARRLLVSSRVEGA